MTEKLLVSEYVTYAKGDGEELRDRYTIENTSEARKELLDDIYYDDAYDSEKDFINGEIDSFQYNSYGGDWDDPTGGFITVETKEQVIKRIEDFMEREKNSIDAYFRK